MGIMTGQYDSLKPLAPDIVETFYQTLPKLFVFANDKFLLENRFQAPCACAHTETVALFNRRFGGLLLGAYGFGLYDRLHEEFPACIAMLAGRGIPTESIEALLRAWIIGIQCLVRRQAAQHLVPPLSRLLCCISDLAREAKAEDPPLEGRVGDFYELLTAQNRKFAAEYILSRIRDGMTIEDVYTLILLPALERIRLLWIKNRLTAAVAHTAEDICRYVMFRVIDSVFGERRYPFRALVACMQGEEDVLSAEVFANFLEIKGWSVFFLGHDASEEDIGQALEANRPQVLVLSVASVSQLYPARNLLSQLKSSFPRVRIFAQGRAIMLVRPYFEPLTDAVISGFEQGHTAMLAQVISHAERSSTEDFAP